MSKPAYNVLVGSTEHEIASRQRLVDMLRGSPIPDQELAHNLGLYMTRQTLSRIMFMNDLYQRIVDVHGIVVEFGVRWGQNLSLFSAFRGMYEPYNHNRKIVGFDTFSGFPSVDAKDGEKVQVGAYGVTEGYRSHIEEILAIQESLSPIPHRKKHELVEGDAVATINEYLVRNPQTIISLAYFDFDLYEPTKACLDAILPRLTRGSVLAFDELNCPEFPGETLAVVETIGLSRYALKRSPLNPLCSYMVID